MNIKKILLGCTGAALLVLQVAPAVQAAYNAPFIFGALTGDVTSTGNNSYATTVNTYGGGKAFGTGASSTLGVENWTNVTTGTTYAASATDQNICSKVATALAVTLPATPPTGRTVHVKDCAGIAASFNITVTPAAGNVDGASNYVININRQTNTFKYDGTQWEVF